MAITFNSIVSLKVLQVSFESCKESERAEKSEGEREFRN